jgi:hypothetical protein
MNYELLRDCSLTLNEVNRVMSLYPWHDDCTGESIIVTIKKTLQGIINDIIFNGANGFETENQIDRCKVALSNYAFDCEQAQLNA